MEQDFFSERRSDLRETNTQRLRLLERQITDVVSELIEQPEHLEQVAFELATSEIGMEAQGIRDRMTGAYKRNVILEMAEDYSRIEQEHTKHRVGGILCDLDNFKDVNNFERPAGDSTQNLIYGHEAGDKVIENFARLVREYGEQNNITGLAIGRLGGEEFLIIVPHMEDTSRLKSIAEGLRAKIESELAIRAGIRHIKPAGQTVSMSSGLIVPGMTGEQLLEQLDPGLYQAKQEGRNKVVEIETEYRQADSSDLTQVTPRVKEWNPKVTRSEEIETRQGEIVEELKQVPTFALRRERRDFIKGFASQRALLWQNLERDISRDKMTGALNKDAGKERLQRLLELELADHHHIGVVIMDVDFFKDVNDTYGHKTGDEVLQALVRQVEKMKELGWEVEVARWGFGEEFLLMISHISSAELENFAAIYSYLVRTRVAGSPSDRHTDEGRKTILPGWDQVTVSMGGRVISKQEPLDRALREIDGLVYEAKRGGRDRAIVISYRDSKTEEGEKVVTPVKVITGTDSQITFEDEKLFRRVIE